MLEQDALGPAITIPERVDHVQVTKVLGGHCNQVAPVEPLQPIGIGQGEKDLVGLGLDSGHMAEVSATLGDIHAAQLARPVVQVPEQLAVDALERGQIVGRWGEFDFAGSNCREAELRFIERLVIKQAQAVAKDHRTGVAVRVLVCTVLVGHQSCLARYAPSTASREGSLRSASAGDTSKPSRRRLAT
ncbi:hypothetical protein D9M68_817370 [compost metagenome]